MMEDIIKEIQAKINKAYSDGYARGKADAYSEVELSNQVVSDIKHEVKELK